MSALRDRSGRFVKTVPDGAPDLPAAMLASGVPGALRCKPPAAPFELCGLVWGVHDATAAPIGLALAMEWHATAKADDDAGDGEPDEAA